MKIETIPSFVAWKKGPPLANLLFRFFYLSDRAELSTFGQLKSPASSYKILTTEDWRLSRPEETLGRPQKTLGRSGETPGSPGETRVQKKIKANITIFVQLKYPVWTLIFRLLMQWGWGDWGDLTRLWGDLERLWGDLGRPKADLGRPVDNEQSFWYSTKFWTIYKVVDWCDQGSGVTLGKP